MMGQKKIFLNADGKNGIMSGELKEVLDYVAGKPSEAIFVKKLEYAVERGLRLLKIFLFFLAFHGIIHL